MRSTKGQFLVGNVPAHAGNATFTCLGCKKVKPCHPYELEWRHYCSYECKKKAYAVVVACAQCGKEKTVRPSEIKKNNNVFCNHKCYSAFKVGKPNESIIGNKHPMKKPENKLKISGKRHGKWTGNLPGKEAVHHWLSYNFGKANHCSSNPLHKSPFDWSNISYQYLREITDWEQLCRRCHSKKDQLAREGLKKNTTEIVFNKKGARL